MQKPLELVLKEPTAAAQQLSKALHKRITQTIQAHHGTISFAKYMQLALYTPGLGYYNNSLPIFGPSGDFVTAPELGTLFANCLANQCAEILQRLGGGMILEIGAGTGKLAKQLIRRLQELQAPLTQYYILETSANLAAIQQEHAMPVTWLQRLLATPQPGIIIANEVLDALPVHCFTVQDHQIYENCVTLADNQQFTWQLTPATSKLSAAVTALNLTAEQSLVDNAEHSYSSEICLYMQPWLQEIQRQLSRGCLLFIDYGFSALEYYHPQRKQGTLMCHSQHRSHQDPFYYPGLQDITAHVNFSALNNYAQAAQLTPLGYTNLAAFLINTKIEQFVQQAQHNEINYLTSPAEMGELFKVIAFGKQYDYALGGFSKFTKTL